MRNAAERNSIVREMCAVTGQTLSRSRRVGAQTAQQHELIVRASRGLWHTDGVQQNTPWSDEAGSADDVRVRMDAQ
ncbi:hypothetical protein IWX63_003217 [Arthrobacter sp. CAN_A2]